MRSRWRAVVQTNGDGRSLGPTISGRVRQTRTQIDADMATDPFATGGIRSRDARLKRGASLIPARCLIAGMKLVGLRGFTKAKANGGGAATNRNDNFSQIHFKPERFIQRS
jgi:hypothetical protein